MFSSLVVLRLNGVRVQVKTDTVTVLGYAVVQLSMIGTDFHFSDVREFHRVEQIGPENDMFVHSDINIRHGQIVPRCKWDNVALGQFRIVTWFTQRLSPSLGRAERDILMIRRGKSSDVSKFEINVLKIEILQEEDRSDTTFFWASSTTFNYTEKLTLRHQLASYSCIDVSTLLVDDVNMRQVDRTKGKPSVDTSLSVLKCLLKCSAYIE